MRASLSWRSGESGPVRATKLGRPSEFSAALVMFAVLLSGGLSDVSAFGLAGQSKIGCITRRRFAKAGTKTHSQRGAALDRNGLSVSTETACNTLRGFGFIALDSGGKDVFVHASALQRAGIMGLSEGQRVFVGIAEGLRGPEAASIRVAY
jgi:cold shock CspA family protein